MIIESALLEDVAILIGLLGPAGLIGYSIKIGIWKTNIEMRISSIEKEQATLLQLQLSLDSLTKELHEQRIGFNDLLHNEIRRLEDKMSTRHKELFGEVKHLSEIIYQSNNK